MEEDKDALVLRCVADANPPASIVWRRAGRSEIASLQVSLLQHPTQPCGKLWPRLPASAPAPATILAAVWPEIAPSLGVFILSVAEICNCIKLLTRFPPLRTLGNTAAAPGWTTGRRAVHLPGTELGGHLGAAVGAAGREM